MFLSRNALAIWVDFSVTPFKELITQTSHIKNCLETLKNKGNLAY